MDDMNTNINDSTIKLAVDTWFDEIFKLYFTNLSKDYNDYLEDTIWCNDRSMNTYGGNEYFINNGWIPNGGNVSYQLWYSSYGRRQTGNPSLECSNKNDSFTVNETESGNGALTYPVGLLTADEIMLAGGRDLNNSDFYLYTNKSWWLMSPRDFDLSSAIEYVVYSDGTLGNDFVNRNNGVRPSISLKYGIKVNTNGDGTATSPYEIVIE